MKLDSHSLSVLGYVLTATWPHNLAAADVLAGLYKDAGLSESPSLGYQIIDKVPDTKPDDGYRIGQIFQAAFLGNGFKPVDGHVNFAGEKGHYSAMKWLLERAKLRPQGHAINWWDSPLADAIRAQNEALAILLIENGHPLIAFGQINEGSDRDFAVLADEYCPPLAPFIRSRAQLAA